MNWDYLTDEVKEIGESIKKVKLKLDDEKVGINDFLDYNTNSGIKPVYDR